MTSTFPQKDLTQSECVAVTDGGYLIIYLLFRVYGSRRYIPRVIKTRLNLKTPTVGREKLRCVEVEVDIENVKELHSTRTYELTDSVMGRISQKSV